MLQGNGQGQEDASFRRVQPVFTSSPAAKRGRKRAASMENADDSLSQPAKRVFNVHAFAGQAAAHAAANSQTISRAARGLFHGRLASNATSGSRGEAEWNEQVDTDMMDEAGADEMAAAVLLGPGQGMMGTAMEP